MTVIESNKVKPFKALMIFMKHPRRPRKTAGQRPVVTSQSFRALRGMFQKPTNALDRSLEG